jgi:hypothetical protein
VFREFISMQTNQTRKDPTVIESGIHAINGFCHDKTLARTKFCKFSKKFVLLWPFATHQNRFLCPESWNVYAAFVFFLGIESAATMATRRALVSIRCLSTNPIPSNAVQTVTDTSPSIVHALHYAIWSKACYSSQTYDRYILTYFWTAGSSL